MSEKNSEEALKKTLECPVCLCNFDQFHRQPRVVPCGNNVCTSCLQIILGMSKKCPMCNEKLGGNLKSYPINLFLKEVTNLSQENLMNTIKKVGKNKVEEGEENRETCAGFCSIHKNLQLQLRCMVHKKWICSYCLKDKHSTCRVKTVSEAIKECRIDAEAFWAKTLHLLEKKRNSYDDKVVTLTRRLIDLKTEISTFKRKKEETKDRIKRAKTEKNQTINIQTSHQADEFFHNYGLRLDAYQVSDNESENNYSNENEEYDNEDYDEDLTSNYGDNEDYVNNDEYDNYDDEEGNSHDGDDTNEYDEDEDDDNYSVSNEPAYEEELENDNEHYEDEEYYASESSEED